MAGERIGKVYEALIKVVLDQLKTENCFLGSVFWNQKPEGISVEPDLSIGVDYNHPQFVFMVTHCNAIKKSPMKAARNMGELSELKTSISPMPIAINIIFDAVMENGLKHLQSAAFDEQIIVGDMPYGSTILTWAHSHQNDFNIGKNNIPREFLIDIKRNHSFTSALNALKADICTCICKSQRPNEIEVWEKEQLRAKEFHVDARITHLRRGFTKRLLAGQDLDNLQSSNVNLDWLVELGLVGKAISGYRIIDEDLLWFVRSPWNEHYKTIATVCTNDGFWKQVNKVRSIRRLSAYEDYVVSNICTLQDPKGMESFLSHCRKEPSYSLSLPPDVAPPENLWIYDFIGALEKARNGKLQAFGCSIFSNHPKANSQKIGNMSIGEWCEAFSNTYFNLREGFSIPDGVEAYIALVLSDTLRTFDAKQIQNLSGKTKSMFLAKEYEATLLSYNGFDPLLGVLIDAEIIKNVGEKVSIKSCFAESAGLGGRTGNSTVIRVKNTIINWQSATDSGRDHKRKELSGKAVAIRYTWNPETKCFIPRSCTKKLILLLDGTWRQSDINTLINAGWDEIYYPDELDKLKEAIV